MGEPQPNTIKKQRTRSPAYPSFDLATAIEKIALAYEANERHAVDPESLAAHLKYTATSSSFMQAISTLKQFGLLDDAGWGPKRRLSVSDLALDILLAEVDSPKKSTAIKEAALNPKIHAEIWAKYNGNLPPKDESIRFYLLREREDGVFNRSQVDGVIAEFRATIAFAKLTEDDKIEQDKEDQKGRDLEFANVFANKLFKPLEKTPPRREGDNQKASGPVMRDLPITLPSLQVAIIRVPFPMDLTDYDALSASLAAFKPALVKQPEEVNRQLSAPWIDPHHVPPEQEEPDPNDH